MKQWLCANRSAGDMLKIRSPLAHCNIILIAGFLTALTFAACGNSDDGNGNTTSFSVANAAEWQDALTVIKSDDYDSDNFIINLTGDFNVDGTSYENQTFGSVTGITVSIRGDGHTISISPGSYGSLLCIKGEQTLVLDKVILMGHNNNNKPLVSVEESAILTMNDGTVITGNTSDHGGGVRVWNGGSFIMEGGTISGNTSDDGGGGVYVSGPTNTNGGSFTMNGGTISGNTSDHGGGVTIGIGSSFTMTGGAISDNTVASDYYSLGGGVSSGTNCTFTMKGGIISGNIGDGGGGVYIGRSSFTMEGGIISGNTAVSNNHNYGGGGVLIFAEGSFTKTGGTIYGSDENGNDGDGKPLKNTASADTQGYAVLYKDDSTSYFYYRDITLNATNNISTDKVPQTAVGGYDGTNWIKRP